MKIILVGYPGSQCIVPSSRYLAGKYFGKYGATSTLIEFFYLNYTGEVNGWSDYLVDYLSTIDDENIIFTLDDYLISDYIDRGSLESALSEIGGDVVCVKLCHSTPEEHAEYPVTTQYTIWNREYLISLLKKVNTPWEFEIHGSRMFDKKVLHRPCIKYFTNSSISGRWEGINLSGLKQEDITYMQEHGLLPKENTTFSELNSTDKVVVFGGSGFLGVSLIDRLIGKGYRNIVVVARNEGALTAAKEKFPIIQVMVGDIADAWVVRSAMANAKEVYLLSAMKHVGLAEVNVNTCIMTNIIGAMNVVNESFASRPRVLMFISTDKASQGAGVYGCTKKIIEKLLKEAEKVNLETKYRVIRYGNVWGSTGSIITKWRPKLEKGEEVILTDPEASRFFWTVDEAVDLIFECIDKAENADPFIPKMKAIKMGVVLEACMDVYGKSSVKVIGLQPGENKVETTDGVTFSDQCEQFTKSEFIEKFLRQDKKFRPWAAIQRERYDIDQDGVKKGGYTYTPGLLSQIDDLQKPKISCVLITKDAQYPEIVLERLNQGFFDEIIIVTECESIYHRYLAAQKAKNDIIYVQDDDCLVNYQVLFKHYDGRITNTMTKEFQEKYKDTGCTLVGWGCYFPKWMLNCFDAYIAKYGIDNHLLREADRIFTYLNQPFNTGIMRHEDLPQATAGDRMGYQEDHYTSMQEALKKCAEL